MLDGNPLKKITLFAIPCILGSILQNVYNMADTVIVGRVLGVNALAAVGSTGVIFSAFIMAINGLASGFSIIAGKKYGAAEYDDLKKVFVNSLIVMFFVGLAVMILGTIFVRPMLMAMNTPDEIIDDAAQYLFIIFAGVFSTTIYNLSGEMIRALGDSRRPFIYLMISCFINIILDLLFMAVFKMGVAGAAVATVISQTVSACLCMIYIFKSVYYFRFNRGDIRPDLTTIKSCLRLGIPSAILGSVISFSGMAVQIVTNLLGTECIAAASGASKVTNILSTPVFGFATALSVFIAQNNGAGKMDRIRQGIRVVNIVLICINAGMVVLALSTSRLMMTLMADGNDTVITYGCRFINVATVSAFALVPLVVYKSAMQALEKPFFPVVSGFLEIALRFTVSLVLSKYYGFWGVILASPITWVVTGLFCITAYYYEAKKMGLYGRCVTEVSL